MSFKGSQIVKHLRVLWCMLETFSFAGLHYGWPSLVYVLKQEGFFLDECETPNITAGSERDAIDCDHQDGQLALLYSLANGFAIIPFFLCGTCISRYGPIKTRIVWTCMFVLGCVMMIVSSPDRPWFACAGLTLLAGGGRVYLLTNMQINSLYKTGTFIVIALMNGCFDSSTAMMLFVKLAFEAGIERRISFAVILGLSLTTFISTFVNFNLKPSKDAHDESNERVDVGSERDRMWTLCQIYKQYVFNKLCLSHFAWFTVMAINFSFFITSSNIYIQEVTDNGAGTESSMTNFLSIALFVGVVPALLSGIFMERFQRLIKGSMYVRDLKTSTVAFITTSVLSALVAALTMFHDLTTAYTSFILLPIFRAFLFSITYAFIAIAFPFQVFGALAALIGALTCIPLLIQGALVKWQQSNDHAELHLRITLLVMSVISLFHPIMLLVKIRNINKEDKEVEENEHISREGDGEDQC